jgi:arsenical pump membrane protein
VADAGALALALGALAATLTVAVVRPPRVPEAAVAVLGALILLAAGAISLTRAEATLRDLGGTVAFLAALLLLAEGCRREGLFAALGGMMAARAGTDPRRLLALVFAVATAVTIVLGLDATVVLLPPIVLATARRLRHDPRTPLYACAHLANSASLLLPVSNLTNLLAFRASGLAFTHFALLMALPTVGVVAVAWAALSRRRPGPECDECETGRDPGARTEIAGAVTDEAPPALPRFAVTVLALTLVGFAASSPIHIAPVWVAVAGAVLLNLPALRDGGRTVPPALIAAAEPGFLIFVLGLGVIVGAAGLHGLTAAVRDVVPSGSSLPDLLEIAAISAVTANVVNNLPATLILVPVIAGFGPGPVLAVLIGVNVGPNLTPVGSLATLLWRRVLAAEGVHYPGREFTRLGLMTVPPAIVLATGLLWLGLRV